MFAQRVPNAAHKVGKHKVWVTRPDVRFRVPNSCHGCWFPGCDAEVRLRVPNAGCDCGFRSSQRGFRIWCPCSKSRAPNRIQNSEHIVGNWGPEHAVGTHTGTGTPSPNPESESGVKIRVRKSTLGGIRIAFMFRMQARRQLPSPGSEVGSRIWVPNSGCGFYSPNVADAFGFRIHVPNTGPGLKVPNFSTGFRVPNV